MLGEDLVARWRAGSALTAGAWRKEGGGRSDCSSAGVLGMQRQRWPASGPAQGFASEGGAYCPRRFDMNERSPRFGTARGRRRGQRCATAAASRQSTTIVGAGLAAASWLSGGGVHAEARRGVRGKPRVGVADADSPRGSQPRRDDAADHCCRDMLAAADEGDVFPAGHPASPVIALNLRASCPRRGPKSRGTGCAPSVAAAFPLSPLPCSFAHPHGQRGSSPAMSRCSPARAAARGARNGCRCCSSPDDGAGSVIKAAAGLRRGQRGGSPPRAPGALPARPRPCSPRPQKVSLRCKANRAGGQARPGPLLVQAAGRCANRSMPCTQGEAGGDVPRFLVALDAGPRSCHVKRKDPPAPRSSAAAS